jgi:hypothetical protein
MKQSKFSQAGGGKPNGNDQQGAGVASLTPTPQDQGLAPSIAVDGRGPVGRPAMQVSTEGAGENKPTPKQNDAATAAKASEHVSRSVGPRNARTKRSNKAATKDKIKAPPERVEKSQIKPAKTLRVSGWKRWGSKWLDQTLGLFQKAGSEGTANPKRRKPPGVRAQKRGTRLKRGAAVQVMAYPRPKTKAVLVEASRKDGLSLSSFLIRNGLKRAAVQRGCKIEDLVPPDELRQYV